MKDLLNRIVKYLPFIIWLVLAIVSLTLLVQNNPYHRSIWFGSANAVVGSVYDVQSNITGYFGLRDINEDLLERNGQLEEENLLLRQQLQAYQDQILLEQEAPKQQYSYTIAHVVSNSINLAENYITLDKGSRDGIKQDLGVADQNGVIGLVAKVSEHYSLVLSVLNPKLRLSVMLQNSSAYGSLYWDGADYRHAILADLPRNVNFEVGDTVVTTGYTSTFPKNVPVGRVKDWVDRGENFLSIRIELFADFNRLNDVHVIFNEQQEERDMLNKLTD